MFLGRKDTSLINRQYHQRLGHQNAVSDERYFVGDHRSVKTTDFSRLPAGETYGPTLVSTYLHVLHVRATAAAAGAGEEATGHQQ